jgi:alcohol dehydrogenase class IV
MDVKKGIQYFKDFKPDLIIAVGGGSVLDMAKLINIFSAQKTRCDDVIDNKVKISVKGIPLVAIPTTAGSGSEATGFSVLYVNSMKYSIAHQYMLPDCAIVDPTLTHSMSPQLTAVTGMDALSQSIESFWAVGATGASRRYSSRSIQIILHAIRPAVQNPDKGIRAKMAMGAHLSGKAINIAKTTAPHAISYALTMFHGLAHGHAAGLTLPDFFLINSKPYSGLLNGNLTISSLKRTMNRLFELFGCGSAESCAQEIRILMKEIGLETDFGKLGIVTSNDVERILAGVNVERLANNPVKVTPDMLRQVLSRMASPFCRQPRDN